MAIKKPVRAGNGLDYDSQICQTLDRTNKIWQFDLATSIQAAGIQFGEDLSLESDDNWYGDDNDNNDSLPHQINQMSDLLANIDSVSALGGPQRHIVDYFQQASDLRQDKHPQAPCPFCTLTMASTTFQLPWDPQLKKISIDIALKQFDLTDLCPALAEYLQRI